MIYNIKYNYFFTVNPKVMRSSNLLFLLSLIFCLIFNSCDSNNDNITPRLNNSDVEVKFPTANIGLSPIFSPGAVGFNINFACQVNNYTSKTIDIMPVKTNFYYSPNASIPYSAPYFSDIGITSAPTPPNSATYDYMGFSNHNCCNAIQNCCNSCCPGFYKCEIKAYDPNYPTNLVTTGIIEIHIQASGSYTILQQ